MHISVCIATCRRPDRLAGLLGDLVRQRMLPTEVTVVDNDAAGSARAVVQRRRDWGAPFPIYYDIHPESSLSLIRRRTIALANGEWLAFIDDNERAPDDWLQGLADAVLRYNADGAVGPVTPDIPGYAPAWIQRGQFYDRTRMTTGTVVSGSGLRLGNVLLQSSLLRSLESPFDAGTEATPASDNDVLGRLVRGGARLVWCDEAIVHETVDGSRLSLRWLLLRALRDGQEAARDQLTVRRGRLPRANRYALLLSAIAHSVTAASLAVLSWPRGHHHAARWLIEATTQVGTIPILLTSEPVSSARDSAPTARRAA